MAVERITSVQTSDFVNVKGTDWTQIGSRAHAVQFYEHDDTLSDLLATYVGTALIRGDAAIVVATQKHRDDLRATLAQRGLNLGVPEGAGRYESFDAAETLRAISSPTGWPDPDRFASVIGGAIDLVRGASRSPARIAIYGEMVALLCANGQFAAAIRLEELWNDLARECEFSLCCAYPMGLFKSNETAAARFMKVCAQHSHVFPAERRSATSSNSRSRSRSRDRSSLV
jgi:hypothetical protein